MPRVVASSDVERRRTPACRLILIPISTTVQQQGLVDKVLIALKVFPGFVLAPHKTKATAL